MSSKKAWVVSWLSTNQAPDETAVDIMVFETKEKATNKFKDWCLEAKSAYNDVEIKNEYKEENEKKEQIKYVIETANYADAIIVKAVVINKQCVAIAL